MNRLLFAGLQTSLLSGLFALSLQSASAEIVSDYAGDYTLNGDELTFTSTEPFTGSVTGYGTIINAAGAPLDFSDATITAQGGRLALKREKAITARYLRFNCSATYPGVSYSNSGLALVELQLVRNGEVQRYPDGTACTALASNGTTFDASACKYIVNHDLHPGGKSYLGYFSDDFDCQLTVAFGGEMSFDSYRFYVADVPGRDPYSWTVEVSSDGETWRQVSAVNKYHAERPIERFFPSDTFALGTDDAFASDCGAVSVPTGTSLAVIDGSLNLDAATVAGSLHLVNASVTLSGESTFTGKADGTGHLAFDGVVNGGFVGDTATKTCRQVRMTILRNRGHWNFVEGTANPNYNYFQGWALSQLNLTLGGERVAYPEGTTVSLTSLDPALDATKLADAQNILKADTSAIYYNREQATIITITMPEDVTFDGYNWFSRGDMPCRDPRSWRFEWTEDGQNWVLFDDVRACYYRELAPEDTELRNAMIYDKTVKTSSLSVSTAAGDYLMTIDAEGHLVPSLSGDATFTDVRDLPATNVRLTGGTLTYGGTDPLDGLSLSGSGTFDLGLASLENARLDVAADASFNFRAATQISARYYRLTVKATRPNDTFSNQGPQIGEIELMNDVMTIPYDAAASVTATPEAVESAALRNLINNNPNDKCFYKVGIQEVAFMVDLGSVKSFTGYRFNSGNDAPGRDPYSWTFEISVDGDNWQPVHAVEAYRPEEPLARMAFTEAFALHTRPQVAVVGGTIAGALGSAALDLTLGGETVFSGTLSGPDPVAFDGVPMNGRLDLSPVQNCRYVRFTSLATRPGAEYSNQGPQMGELVLFRNGEALAYDTLVTKCTASASGDYDAKALVDNNIGNKVFQNVGSGVRQVSFTVDLGSMREFDGYGFYSGNDGTGRDPVSFTFDVSKDGVVWTRLDSQSDRTDLSKDRQALIYSTTFSPLAKDAISDTSVLELGADGAVTLDDVRETVAGLSGAGTLTLQNGATLTVRPNGEIPAFTGTLAGTGTVIIDGGVWPVRKAKIDEGITVECVNGGRVKDLMQGFVIIVR